MDRTGDYYDEKNNMKEDFCTIKFLEFLLRYDYVYRQDCEEDFKLNLSEKDKTANRTSTRAAVRTSTPRTVRQSTPAAVRTLLQGRQDIYSKGPSQTSTPAAVRTSLQRQSGHLPPQGQVRTSTPAASRTIYSAHRTSTPAAIRHLLQRTSGKIYSSDSQDIYSRQPRTSTPATVRKITPAQSGHLPSDSQDIYSATVRTLLQHSQTLPSEKSGHPTPAAVRISAPAAVWTLAANSTPDSQDIIQQKSQEHLPRKHQDIKPATVGNIYPKAKSGHLPAAVGTSIQLIRTTNCIRTSPSSCSQEHLLQLQSGHLLHLQSKLCPNEAWTLAANSTPGPEFHCLNLPRHPLTLDMSHT
ncbi:hypothetical protein HNY73_018729 [Argiope bruennichi]|uniref:Uncharacterized protein n=1 Tax=Argiope bruennichi TaxID=94029 RepID=A0A8T0EF82_ARGBR|nr:hypothetical protein HNY73_018729 [Argiope bruennichi]